MFIYICWCLFVSSFEDVTGGGAADPCTPNPCKNGGTCSSVGDKPKCVCATGFSGQYCDGKYALTLYNHRPKYPYVCTVALHAITLFMDTLFDFMYTLFDFMGTLFDFMGTLLDLTLCAPCWILWVPCWYLWVHPSLVFEQDFLRNFSKHFSIFLRQRTRSF